MSVAEVHDLNKTYPAFALKRASFSIEEGRITGFIGRNGAGKTTTIKSMLNLVHPDSGEIFYFGKPLAENETEIKKLIGYSTGAVNWYPRKKLKDVIAVVKRCYDTWDEDAYRRYLALFALDENKPALEMSEGMRVKYNLLVALSHNARAHERTRPVFERRTARTVRGAQEPRRRGVLLHAYYFRYREVRGRYRLHIQGRDSRGASQGRIRQPLL